MTGTAEFGDTVGGSAALDSIDVSQGTTSAANISTTASQTYDGDVMLGARTDLTGSTVTFGQHVNGGFNLFVDANAISEGDVNIFGLAADQTATIAASSVTTSGGQRYVGNVTLGADTTLTDTTNNAYGIEFFGTITGAFNLTLSADDRVVLPTSASIASLNISGSGPIDNQSASDITTSGDQTYAGALTLGGNATLSGANIRFDSTVDSATGIETLPIVGNVTFDGDVGDTSQLGTLSVDGAAALDAAIYNTGGTQTYAGPVTLGTVGIGIYASVATFENSLTLGATAATANDELLAYGNLVLQGEVTATIFGTNSFGFVATNGGGIDLTTGSPIINLVYAGFTPAATDAFDLLRVSGGSILGALANAPPGGIATIAGAAFVVREPTVLQAAPKLKPLDRTSRGQLDFLVAALRVDRQPPLFPCGNRLNQLRIIKRLSIAMMAFRGWPDAPTRQKNEGSTSNRLEGRFKRASAMKSWCGFPDLPR